MEKLNIIHEDSTCIVINKPAGLAVQGGKGIGKSLDSILAQALPQRPLLVHRLDKDTSGLILVAKTKKAAADYSRLFGGKGASAGKAGIVKRYLAVCKGSPKEPEGLIKLDLVIDGKVKKSKTGYRLVEKISNNGDFSLLELEPETGRMHQIRRHLALIGHSVLGDDKYGDFALNHFIRKTIKINKLFLHASQLLIPETPGYNRLDLKAPLPEYFRLFCYGQ
jgi:23S rRNA pseudouridine955/2504/2580 synthase